MPKTITVNCDDMRRLMTGGNHLASALIGWLGATEKKFPPYKTSHEAARLIIVDLNKYDAWCCWKAIMEFRDLYWDKQGC